MITYLIIELIVSYACAVLFGFFFHKRLEIKRLKKSHKKTIELHEKFRNTRASEENVKELLELLAIIEGRTQFLNEMLYGHENK